MIEILAIFVGLLLFINLTVAIYYAIYKCRNSVIYADYNASTPISQKSIDAWEWAAREGSCNPSSYHFGGRRSRLILEEKRQELAEMVGCDKSELIFTSGSTESNNAIIQGLFEFYAHDARGKKIGVITTPIEHASVTEPLEELEKKTKITLHFTPVESQTGYVNLEETQKVIESAEKRGEPIAMMCIIVGNNEIGTLQDMSRISKLAKEKKIFLHADMTQIVGKYKVDFRELDVDSAAFSGHKFHGPKGVGCLFIRNNRHINIEAFIRGGKQEMGYRAGTENIASVCAMVAALSLCYKRIDDGDTEKVKKLRDETLSLLQSELGKNAFKVFGDPANGLYNTLCLGLPVNSRVLIQKMNEDGHHIYVNTGCACSQGQGSKVLKAIGASEEDINGSLRISYGFMNENGDARCLAKTVAKYVKKLQS